MRLPWHQQSLLCRTLILGWLWCLPVWIVTPAAADPGPTTGPSSIGETGEDQASLDPVTLQLKWNHAFQFAGYYAAKEMGYYQAAGLDVNIVEAHPGLDPVDEVLEGRANYGTGDSSLLLRRVKGDPVVALGVIFQHSAIILLELQRGPEQSIHSLAGKRVMLVPNDYELRAYLAKVGLTPDRYEEVENSFRVEDLIEGKTDAFSAYVTNQTFALDRANIPYVAYTPRSSGIDFYGDNFFTSDAELKQHRSRTKSFREATIRGWTYAMDHPEEIVDLILSEYPTDRDKESLLYEAKQMVPLIQPVLVEMGYMSLGRWRHIAQTYADIGMLPRDVSLDGFLYEHKVPTDLRWWYRSLGGALLGLLLIGFVAVRYYRMSRELKVDITAREKAERDKERLESQLLHVQKMQAIGTLAGGVAHDMNNVLAVVLGLGSTIEDDMSPEDPLFDDIRDIVDAARRGQALVANLLGFARKGDYTKSEWSPNEGILQMSSLLTKMISKGVVITTTLQATRHVMCDENQMATVLMNLCINAADAIPVAGSITIQTKDRQLNADDLGVYPNLGPGWYIEIRVQDDGEGMDEGTCKRAFEPFFTTKDIGKGTGLGLSMVLGVVENHGGYASIESVVGEGTSVTILLPSIETSDQVSKTNLKPERAMGKGKILVVDDEALIRRATSRMLERAGYDVTTADGGHAAIKIFSEPPHDFDLVVLDLSMPEMNGNECFKNLQSIDPGVRVLISTGHGNPADTAEMVAKGAVGVMCKPFAADELCSSVSNALAQRTV